VFPPLLVSGNNAAAALAQADAAKARTLAKTLHDDFVAVL
jgi:hypothetical protein